MNPTQEELTQQNYKIARLGLSPKDEMNLRLELTSFRAKFEAFNAEYSGQAEKGFVTPHAFWAGAALITGSTRDNLKKNLSAAGHDQFEAGVQHLRENTRYFTSTGGVL